jgi:glycosyltransferase involved in cell wall biosynthesis
MTDYKMNALVSVIIPTFNRRTLICETVDSVLAQTHRNIEVIVADDGSTDGTGELLETKYSGESRFRCIRQDNAERAAARNTGIKAARGEYIAFLDSDDLWRPKKLERQLECFAKNPALVMVHCACSTIDDHGQTTGQLFSTETDSMPEGFIFEQLVCWNAVGAATPVVRRELFDRIGLFNEDPRVLCFEDWEMWTRIAALGPVGYVREALASYRVHTGNTYHPPDRIGYTAFLDGIIATVPKAQRRVARVACVEHYWRLAAQSCKAGKRFESLLTVLQGVFQTRLFLLRSVRPYRFLLARIIFGEKEYPKREKTGMQKRSILIVAQMGADLTHPVLYGADRATVEMGKALAALGWCVTLASVSREHAESVCGLPFRGYPSDSSMADDIRDGKADPFVVGISRGDVLVAPGVRGVVYHHNPSFVDGGLPAWWYNQNRIQIVCVSRFAAQRVEGQGIAAQHTSAILNGLRLSDEGASDVCPEREKHQLLFVGNPFHYKGIDLVIAAFLAIRKRHSDATLLIAGGGEDDWREYHHHVLKPEWITDQGHLAWNVIEREVEGLRYLGPVEHKEAIRLMKQSSLLIHASRVDEACPIVALEAQAVGCIPVLPRRGGFIEIVQDGLTGFLYDDSKAGALADAVCALWEKPQVVEQCRRPASEWARQTFSWEKAARSFECALEKARPLSRRGYIEGRLCMTFHNFRKRLRNALRKNVPGMWRIIK